MPLSITNRSEKGSPLTMQEMDNDILERIVDAINGLEALLFVSLNSDGTLKNPGFFTGSSTNGTDTYTATVVGVTAQAGLLGRLLVLKCDVANSGPATLNVNAYGAFPIMRFQDQALESDYIKAGRYIFLTWDGANYMMQSTPGIVQPANYALDTGAANALVVVKSGWIEIPATLYSGYLIRVKVAAANTGPAAIVIGALPSVPIKRSNGSDLLPNDLTVGKIVDLIYDGVNFQAPQLGTAKYFTALGNALSTYAAGGTVEFGHGFAAVPNFYQVSVICISADKGYSVDDVIDVSSIQIVDPGTTERASFSPFANATNIGAALTNYGGGNRFGVVQKGTGAGAGDSVALDETKWKLQVKGFVL